MESVNNETDGDWGKKNKEWGICKKKIEDRGVGRCEWRSEEGVYTERGRENGEVCEESGR